MKAKVIKTGEVVDVYHEPQHGQITNIYKESVFVNGRMWTEDELDFSVKANDAPEKIYISNFDIEALPKNEQLSERWYEVRTQDTDIEYTRTDAFMEKAEKFFEENIKEEECKIGCSEWTELRSDYKSLDSFISAFRKYMEK